VLQCVAVCCSVLQCVAVCCSVLQCVAVKFYRQMVAAAENLGCALLLLPVLLLPLALALL